MGAGFKLQPRLADDGKNLRREFAWFSSAGQFIYTHRGGVQGVRGGPGFRQAGGLPDL